jgi:predicted phage terminase large subunit-like protein
MARDLSAIIDQLPDRTLVLAEKARRKLHVFLEHFAWPALQPGIPFQDNWHLHAMCEHLEAVKSGEIKRLIINVPFRMLKSTVCSVAFPAWEWTSKPEIAYLTSSYAMKLSTKDAVDTRRVIESRLYQKCWGHIFQLVHDQDEKTRYENNRRGMRTVTSTDSAGTGFGGNRIIVDDPISAKLANSPVAIEASIEWWKGTGVTRLNNQQEDAVIIVHQRLAQRDLTGHILAEEKGWEHLVLPMHYSREHAKTTSLGFVDPRREDGELMFPKRIGEDACKAMENALGAYHAAAQLEQRPDARAGVLFKPDLIQTVKVLPVGMRVVAGWDLAGTSEADSDTAAYTARALMGMSPDGSFGFIHVMRDRKDADEVYGLIKSTSKDDSARFQDVEISLPQDPGQAGKSQAAILIKLLAGFTVECTPESGDKVTRATPLASQVNAGNVWMLEGDWNADFREEMRKFPGGRYKDMVDAASRAFNKLAGDQTLDGILTFYEGKSKAEAEAKLIQMELEGRTGHVHIPAPKKPWELEED